MRPARLLRVRPKRRRPQRRQAPNNGNRSARVIHRFNIEAFPLSRETEAALEGLRAEREFSKVKLAILFGGLPRAVKHYADNPSPRVIIVEDPSGIDQLLKNLEQMAEVVEPGRKVIVI